MTSREWILPCKLYDIFGALHVKIVHIRAVNERMNRFIRNNVGTENDGCI